MSESEPVQNSSAIGLFIAEAKRRHVFRTAGLYAGGAFIVLQLADILMPSLGFEESAITYLLMIIAGGFPLALIAAWVVDISGDGIRVTPRMNAGEKLNLAPGRLVDLVIVSLALGVGYLYIERFVLTEEIAVAPSREEGKAESAASEELLAPSIAVLPFENLSASKENEYFAAGIHEDILNDLSQIDELIVTSRTTTLAYAESTKSIPLIAEELNVNYVMEGSIRRSGNRVRISVQLIDASQDKHIWSEGYERDLKDVFEVQADVARQVSHALKVQFDIGRQAGESPTDSLEAYELFLEARVLASTLDPGNVEASIQKYRQALTIDSEYSDAWAGLALALQSTRIFGKSDQQIEEATVAADKALLLTPDSWMANYAKAQQLGGRGLGLYAQAAHYYEKAISINDNDGELLSEHGFNLWFLGRSTEAQEQFLKAYSRDPLSAAANLSRAMVAIFDKEEQKAAKFIDRAIEIKPNSTYINFWAGAASSIMGEYEQAGLYFSRVLEQSPSHLTTMLWVSGMMSGLSKPELSEFWLDKIEAIAPNNPFYLQRRADTFAAQLKPDEFARHIDDWLAREPDNIFARQFESYASAQRAEQAFDREDMQSFRVLQNKAVIQGLDYLKLTGKNGELVVRYFNSWNFLATAYYAASNGQNELAHRLFQQVLDHYADEPEGAQPFRHLHLAVAHAGLGNVDSAIVHIHAMRVEGFRRVYLIEAFELIGDKYNIYSGIDTNIAFMHEVEKMKEQNIASLDYLKINAPNLFPSELELQR